MENFGTKAKAVADPQSCLNKAKDDEMIFVLLERDPAGIATVQFWINERIRLGINQPNDSKIKDAERWIEEAERRAKEN